MQAANSLKTLLALTAVTAFSLAVPMSAQPKYVVTDLGTLGGTSASANAINNLGQVAGNSSTGSQTHAYRTGPNTAINPSADDLGTLGGAFSTGEAINDSGQVAGTSSNGTHSRAYRSTANNQPIVLTDLGTFIGTGSSFGRGINSSGQVTGGADAGFPAVCFGIFQSHAFRTTATGTLSTATDLGTQLTNNCRSSQGIGINDNGVVAGESATTLLSGIPDHAVEGTPGSALFDMHSGSFASSQAYKINNTGLIIGTATVTGFDTRCFRTATGQTFSFPQDEVGNLGGGFCNAFGINDAGDVVGNSFNSVAIHAYLYTGGTTFDLNNLIGTNPGVVLTMATGINTSGQISAGGFVNGDTVNFHAFRLDPAGVAVTNLITLLSDPSLGLTNGQISSLTDKLQSALDSLQQGLFKQAANQLNSLVNSVQTLQKNGKISVQTAATLLSAANAILAAL